MPHGFLDRHEVSACLIEVEAEGAAQAVAVKAPFFPAEQNVLFDKPA